MTDTAVHGLHVTRRFDASPERLFEAWTEPNLAARWLFTGPTSETHSAKLDVRVGGRWEITDRRDGVDYRALGEYLEVERPRRLVFTFGMPQFSPEFDKVTVDILPDGLGAIVTLRQERLPPEFVEATEQGWREMFDALERRLTQDGYAEALSASELRVTRLFPGSVERLWDYLTRSELRGQWFAAGPMELKAGGRLELTFRHADLSPVHVPPPERYAATKAGATVVGRVLICEPPRRLAFAWGDVESADRALFELTPEGAATRLTITHGKLKTAADMANVAAGWHAHLAILSDVAAGRAPSPFWSIWRGLEDDYARRFAPN